jgi:SAM-dependent methyltransferase
MPSGAGGRRRTDASWAKGQYKTRAAGYDAELAMFEPLRGEAVDLLALRTGHTVLDVGCGTGLSFAPLERCVGAGGHIVGIEPCAEMLERAATRVARHHWDNVELLPASAGAARLHGHADAALFHFTHDVLRDDAALDHVLAHVKPGAHVVACGLQWAPPWLPAVNAFVFGAAMYSMASLEGLARPWDRLAGRLHDVHVHTAWLGGIYIAEGRLA